MTISLRPCHARFWATACGALVLAFTANACSQVKVAPSNTPVEQALATELEAIRSDAGIAGMTAALLLPDGKLIEVAAGQADVEAHLAMRPDQLMPAGSIGKTFVAATALELVEEGVLDLDTPVAHWVGSRDWYQGMPNGDAITLRMLLNHGSGIEADYIPDDAIFPMFQRTFGPAGVSMADQGFHYNDLGPVIAASDAKFPAGKGFAYSDANYVLVGLLIEDVAGKTLYDEATRRFIRPLGLSHTVPTPRASPDYAAGYEPEAGTVPGFPAKLAEHGRLFFDPSLEWAGGGFASTSGDLARWAQALYGRRVLSSASVDAMINSANAYVPEQYGWGYGLAVQLQHDDAAGLRMMHGGYLPGYSSFMEYRPSTDMSLAIQMNARVGFGANRAAADRLWTVALKALGESATNVVMTH